MSTVATPIRVVLHEGEGSRSLNGERRAAVVRGLLEGGYSVTCTGVDGISAGISAGISEDANTVAPVDASDLVVLREAADPAATGANGTHPGAVPDSDDVAVHFRDITDTTPESVVAVVDQIRDETSSYQNGAWKPWFPVIDYQRCTNCMQCLSFCLFDVYGVDAESQITVKNPDKCKTNCPACSRVCPDVAILFPKYGAGPINGDEVKTEDMEREKMKVDISALLGGDIYSLLRERHVKAASRFGKERDEGKALKERMRCLKKLQGELDIPEEVLMSLPSLDQIKTKAAAVAASSEDDPGARDGTKAEGA